MIWRAFLSSPYMSHACGPQAGIEDALRLLVNLRPFRPVLPLRDVRGADHHCVWSPLIQGDLIRAKRADTGHPFTEMVARAWCLNALSEGGFNTLIVSRTIARMRGAHSFCDRELADAESLGFRIFTDVEIQNGTAFHER